MYLVQRHKTWWAMHDVPPSLRDTIGKPRFAANLKTHDKVAARIKATDYEKAWLLTLEHARRQADDTFHPASWRKFLAEAKNEDERGDREVALHQSLETHLGISVPELESDEKMAKYGELYDLATGETVPFGEHLDDYVATLQGQIEAKSLHMKKTNLLRFAEEFKATNGVDSAVIQRWINREARGGAARSTIHRAVGDLRGYWKYLVGIKAAREIPGLFDHLTMAGAKRAKRNDFSPADLLRLEAKARKRGDDQLADFIMIGMYTGARAEEIASLKTNHVDLTKRAIAMPGTKTDAARREVPIHPKLMPMLRQLMKDAGRGYLFQGLRPDAFGDMAKPLTKRFATLKNGEGFDERYGFHSIRRTVCTVFEDAGVAENLVAHMVGHRLRTMSYGLYSGGPSLATKAKAMKKLRYPQ